MAFNAAISAYGNALSVQGTPTRDRDRHPFPASAHPSPAPSLRQTSASASFTNLPSTATSSTQVSPQSTTVEALLKQHASSPDPKAAALDQAVADRNVLSGQNTQLWKLIEKQRAGYNQILKELERIRGERDSYKNKLVALNALPNGSSDKRQKNTTERGSRPSLDTTSSHTSSSSLTPPHSQARLPPRQNSDDTANQRERPPPNLHASRSFDPISTRMNQGGLHSNASFPPTGPRTASPPPPPPTSAPVQTPSSTRPLKPTPSPLVVPNRVDSLQGGYDISDSPDSSTSSKPPSTGAIDNFTGNEFYSSGSTRPLAHPRKGSLADSVSSIVTSGSSTGDLSPPLTSPLTSVPSSMNSHNFGNLKTPIQSQYTGLNPQPAPPGSKTPLTEHGPPRQRNPLVVAPPSIQSSPASGPPPKITASPPPQPELQPSQLPSQPQMLLAGFENRQHSLSRESRITLPDEARQYIVNMADSPSASPRTDSFSARSKLSTSVFPPPPDNTSTGESGRESEFLDMEEEDESDEESEGVGDITAGAGDPAFDTLRVDKVPAPSRRENNTNGHPGPPLHQSQYLNNYSSQSNSSREDVDAIQSKRKDKSRVGAEEFPLPPPSNIILQRQQALAAQDAQAQFYAQQNPQQQPPLQVQHSPSVPASSPKHMQAMPNQQPHGPPHHPSNDTHTSMQETPYPIHPIQANPTYHAEFTNQPQEKQESTVQAVPLSFRELPLLSSDLPHTQIVVSHSFVRPNDRGKEVLSFIVFVNPGNGKEGWKVEKMYSDVLSLDQRVRNSVGKGVGKKIGNLPEGKLWKDHAPAKVDQRKAVLENYLQTLIRLPVKNNDEVIAFFTSDIVREQKQPVMQAGHKEGYLTKRGKNFGGWKTRFFVLQGPVLEYYDCRGGAHLGSITVTGAQIARQHRTERPPSADDEKEYRHAFLIVEAKKGPGGNHPRHVLCAESDEDRDSWVEMLVRYYTGTYSEDLVFNSTSGLTSAQTNSVAATSQQSGGIGQPRSSTSSNDMSTPRKPSSRGVSRDEIPRGSAAPISLLPPDANTAKPFQSGSASEDYTHSSSPSRSVDPSPVDRHGPSPAGAFDSQKRAMERSMGLPSSLPDSSPLSNVHAFQPDAGGPGQRANSELGHYPDLQDNRSGGYGPNRNNNQRQQHSPEQLRTRDDGRKSFYPTLNTVAPSPTTAVPPPDRVPSPEKQLDGSGKVKISGPMNGAPIPSGFKFGGKEVSSADQAIAANDRREKAKSRSFWGFGKANGDKSHLHAAYPPRAVFGVPLEEALDVAQICNLPAIVFRSIQYLEAKKADQEEGIYRLSGSSAVIKNLKDMFNNEGDVDLLASDEYWDPHAIAGLLKSFLRELPSSILTRDLHLKFLAVIDFVDPQERIRELSQLIAALPLANYSLLRALTAHLILIVQNSNVNKMTMRNVGIVFSPTLGIPAGVFSLMLGEFNRVFNVDADNDDPEPQGDGRETPSEPFRRNSRQYSDAAADQLLGLSGRTLKPSAEETQSDGDDFSIQDESGTETTEGDFTVESSPSSSPMSGLHRDHGIRINEPDTPKASTAKNTKAANAAATRGLNVSVTHSDRGNRHSRMMGLPSSPRPMTQSPSRPELPTNPSPTHTS